MAKAQAAKAANPFAKKGAAQKVPTMKKSGKVPAAKAAAPAYGRGGAGPRQIGGKGMVAPPARKAK